MAETPLKKDIRVMKNKSVLLRSAAAALIMLLFCGGCAEFREFFSEEPPAKKKSVQSKKRKSSKESEYKSRRYSRDPLDSLLFSAPEKSENWSKNSNLNDSEKAALRNALNPEEDATRRAIDRVYRENELKRKKRQESVFGPNPFR